jgi:gliding motility-associated-like protein
MLYISIINPQALKKLSLSFLLLFTSFLSFAQQQTNFWHFGQLAGLDFTTGTPVALTNSPVFTNEGTSTISDAAGNLLFYTDGMLVWDRTNTQMPNGFGLFGDVSTTQSALIIPDPGNINLYYIFTIDDEGADMHYSVVDMTLNSGNGDVTLKNIFLMASMTEKLTAVHHCNNHDIWVTAHDRNNNNFVSYLVTNTGISAPVISSTGIIHTDVHGQMKFSTDGTKIACTSGYQDTVEFFDFDKLTGIVSNPFPLAIGKHTYGVEFSPDNNKLYVTYYDVGSISEIAQYDLTAANIPASKVPLHQESDPILYGLQLASNGKIYVTMSGMNFISVVNSPNTAGFGCNYVSNVVDLDPLGFGNRCMLGLPGFIQSYFHPSYPSIPCNTLSVNFQASDTSVCINDCINYTDLSSGSPSSWEWTFQGAAPAVSTVQNPINVCYSSPGTYATTLVISNGTNFDTITKTITVIPCNPLVVDFQASDATVCPNTCIDFNDLSIGSPDSWQWTFEGASPSAATTQNPNTICYSSPGTYNVTLTISDGTYSDTITKTITVYPFASADAGSDVTVEAGSSVSLDADGGGTYLWSPPTGLSCTACEDPTVSPFVNSTYMVTVTDSNGCTDTDMMNIFIEMKCGKVFVPTAFSPNGDSENDILFVMGDCILTMEFNVFDRWGEKVFSTTDRTIGWDGKYRGKELDTNVFVYYLKASLQDGTEVSQNGNISLIK